MEKLGALLTSGKDSLYAMQLMKEQGFEVVCAITIFSSNKDSFMFHTPAVELVKLQAEALNMPLVIQKTKGEKEKELMDLKKAMKKAKEKYEINGIITGALYSEYQRKRIEKICNELKLKTFSPLWHMNQEREMNDLIAAGYKFVFTRIAAEGLDEGWLGKEIIKKDVEKLVELNKKLGINIAGEGGEFETLVLDMPLFKKKIKLIKTAIQKEAEHSATLIIKEAKLIKKF